MDDGFRRVGKVDNALIPLKSFLDGRIVEFEGRRSAHDVAQCRRELLRGGAVPVEPHRKVALQPLDDIASANMDGRIAVSLDPAAHIGQEPLDDGIQGKAREPFLKAPAHIFRIGRFVTEQVLMGATDVDNRMLLKELGLQEAVRPHGLERGVIESKTSVQFFNTPSLQEQKFVAKTLLVERQKVEYQFWIVFSVDFTFDQARRRRRPKYDDTTAHMLGKAPCVQHRFQSRNQSIAAPDNECRTADHCNRSPSARRPLLLDFHRRRTFNRSPSGWRCRRPRRC